MNSSNSLLAQLLSDFPSLQERIYYKSSLTALSHAMEDVALSREESPLVIACFQHERFYSQEVARYRKLGQKSEHVYVLAAPASESGFSADGEPYAVVPLAPTDELANEWHLVILSQSYSACLVCKEIDADRGEALLDDSRRFKGFWKFDPQVCLQAAHRLLARVEDYRKEQAARVGKTRSRYQIGSATSLFSERPVRSSTQFDANSEVFVERLVTYLQSRQSKFLRLYRALQQQGERERVLFDTASAIRESLAVEDVLSGTVLALSRVFAKCRCILYRCQPSDAEVTVKYESCPLDWPSLQNRNWPLAENPLVQVALAQERAIIFSNLEEYPNLSSNPTLKELLQQWQIRSWVLVPIRYQGQVLGVIEVHGNSDTNPRTEGDVELLEAISAQVGVALAQAEAFQEVEASNQRLQTLERAQNNLIAIVGHELRTPLTTIQICLETLQSEPDMDAEFRQSMMETALQDAERLRKLIQDFLKLTRLDSEQLQQQLEVTSLRECIDLALSGARSTYGVSPLPSIQVELPDNLELVLVDADLLVDVLKRLLDNAFKFTQSDGTVTVGADPLLVDNSQSISAIEVTVSDTGRGLEPEQRRNIFNRFYQVEGALRRSAGGAGLGLAICGRIVKALGGKIWVESEGLEQGSSFHFTIPMGFVDE
ncbi:MAG: DICT sensory domain-containing protein [Cyanobacteria bacterium P01_E01_bin.34]